MIKLLEILRFIGCGLGVFLAYYFGNTPEEILRIMTPWFIGSVAGLSGIEGLFFSEKAAQEKGFEKGSNYQRQNAFWFLSIALIAFIAYIYGWNSYADIALVLVFCLFLILSAINHAYTIYSEKNRAWQNVIRPVLTALLTIVFWHPVTSILFH